jgi:hypothetical protein
MSVPQHDSIGIPNPYIKEQRASDNRLQRRRDNAENQILWRLVNRVERSTGQHQPGYPGMTRIIVLLRLAYTTRWHA